MTANSRAIVLLLATVQFFPSKAAADTSTLSAAAAQVRHPAHSVQLQMQLRTPAEMDETDRVPLSHASSGMTPFRSTVNTDELVALKIAAATVHSPARRGATTSSVLSSSEGMKFSSALAMPMITPSAPVINGISVSGLSQGGGIWVPPDTHGAVGANQFVEVVNQKLAVYSKETPPKLLKSVSLSSFFGYTAPPPGLFAPRVIYDRTWKRWIVIANALHESAGVQKLLIAVSKKSDATGAFYVVRDFNADVSQNGEFNDFPQLGIDQDAVIVTTNVFGDETLDSPYVRSQVITFAKAKAYNGLALEAQFIDAGQPGTLAPPVVLDANPNTFLIAAAPIDYPNGTSLRLFTLTNSSRGSAASLAGPVSVPLAAPYGMPADAQQFGTTDTLLTGDARFGNVSTQVDDTLWQTHTVENGNGLPTPVWYKINTQTHTVTEAGVFYSSQTSFDFNASIVANQEGDMFVTWSSTDPNPDLGYPAANAQVRFSGRIVGDPETDISPGTALFTSLSFYSPDPAFYGPAPWPWGSYSAITIDPASDTQAWLVNQKINSASRWGSQIGRIVFPSQ
jgi:hypothetical protein